jgi:type II secretory pathway component GspD/PulD (secretin)
MKLLRIVCVAFLLSLTGTVSQGQLIATVQKKTGKKFVIDPRVHGDIDLSEKDLSGVSYSDFLMILQVYGFSAFETGGYVEVLPLASARQVGGTFANVRRIESIIEALDVGEPFKPEKCDSHLPERP